MSAAPLHQLLPQASREALKLLAPGRGRLAPPVRAPIFGAARFREHGRSLAAAQQSASRRRRSPAFFPRLRDNIAVLREAHDYIGLQEHGGHHVSPAGEWLLDNYHVVLAQTKEIQAGLPRRYFKHLPVLLDDHLAGLPRVYGMAWAFIAHTDSAVDESLLVEFLGAYQERWELGLCELWALPTSLRAVLIENLRRLSEQLAASKAARELANLCFERLPMLGTSGLDRLLSLMQARGVLISFALQLQQRLHPDAALLRADANRPRDTSVPSDLLVWEEMLARYLPDANSAQAQQQAEEAADNLSVSNAISALRLLAGIDWRSLISRCSALVGMMKTVPAFCDEHDDSQDDTLHAIERLSRQSGRSERDIAQALLQLTRAADGPALDRSSLEASPRYWLQAGGRGALRQALGLPPSRLPAAWPQASRLMLGGYLGCLLVGSLWLTFYAVKHLGARLGLPPGWSAPPGLFTGLLALCAFWPASEAVVAVLNRLISESVAPQRLPRLALPEGIGPAHRVLVAVPAMLVDAAGIRALAHQLRRHYLGNREAHTQFALLTDYLDAHTQHAASDATLLGLAIEAVHALNVQFPAAPGQAERFVLLHRERQWCATQACWMGWERKRGKLEQLIALLAGTAASPFVALGRLSQPAEGVAHVLTLDSDTGLPPGALLALIAVAAHPLNMPRLAPDGRRVLSGYGILQPQLGVRLPTPGRQTPFHWLFSGRCGLDPYSAASSEIYQDLFHAGSFTGKGLLHVQTLQRVLAGRLPTDQVLSHDLIEGALVHCGGVSDVSLIEDAPLHADVAAARIHRWTRGDWQLLPLLCRARHHGLGTLDRWKLLDNLRRSLVAPFSVALILLCAWGAAAPPLAAWALLAAAFGAGPLMGAMAGLLPSHRDTALLHFYRQAGLELLRVAGSTLWSLAQLLSSALAQLDAVGRALYRMGISRRRLLQWTPSALAEAAASHQLLTLLRRHRLVPLLAGLMALSAWALGAPAAVAVLLLWGTAPLWTWWASRPLSPGPTLPQADRDYLLGVAHDTWQFFERHVGAASHHLPPDNVQTLPRLMVAQRSSPTNIGLYLLSLACAHRFGWVSTEALLGRAEATLHTLSLLARHQGHFLNWYATDTLQPLPPAYVSTVDSGNLCGHLLALAGACDEAANAEPAMGTRLRALAGRCRKLADEAQFGFLYDSRRRLFHIGYRLQDQQLDRSYYDLLASEARQACLWAIAKGDVPAHHWAALSRPFFAIGPDVGLQSWSGSMFEYLMPALTLAELPGTSLHRAALTAVQEHRVYARQLQQPWGMSECAYAVMDHTLAYQYAPQGVPRLALRRTPPDEWVVAPYASMLAALLKPEAATRNLRRMQALGARGELGFFEAIDYSPDRQTQGSRYTLVSTYMAHHQGMSLAALANVLLQEAPRRWGMSDPRFEAVAGLLQERIPREVPRLLTPPLAPSHADRRMAARGSVCELIPGTAGLAPTHLLSNGRYSVALRGNGAGWSRWCGKDLTRWRDEALRDAYGCFIYLRRDAQGPVVSLTQHPAPDPQAHYRACFHDDRVVLEAEWSELRSRCTVWVSPEDDIELRQVELWNDSDEPLALTLMSMFEPVLTESRADEAHPAFSNFFVSAAWDPAGRALYLARRPRLEQEHSLEMVHFLALHDGCMDGLRVQTSRAAWLGRHRDAASPVALYPSDQLPEAMPCTDLDPLASIEMVLNLPPHGMSRFTLASAAATTRAELSSLVDRYAQAPVLARSSLMSATFASIRRREMRFAAEDLGAMQLLTTPLCLLLSRPPSQLQLVVPAGLDERLCNRQDLWRFGLSGDTPLMLVSISSPQGLRLVRSLAQALRLWRWGGLSCELVILNAEARSYQMPLHTELLALRDRDTAEQAAIPPDTQGRCGLRVLFADELSPSERFSLMTLARVRLNADGRPLADHVRELARWHEQALDARQDQACTALPLLDAAADEGTAPSPQGVFDAGSGEFSFGLHGACRVPRPWVNVLANPGFGTLVSEIGAGYTWAMNSCLFQITPWSNDPVTDASAEGLFVQDLDSRALWRVGGGCGDQTASQVSHGPGLSRIRQRCSDLTLQASWCVDETRPLKQCRLLLRNEGAQPLHLRVIGMAQWLMGRARADRLTVRTARESLRWQAGEATAGARADLLLALQSDAQGGFGGSTAFMALLRSADLDARLEDWTCDRRELFDARGRLVVPDQFGQGAGGGMDPCAAAARTLRLAPGEQAECVMLLGFGNTPAAARALARAAVAERICAARVVRLHAPVASAAAGAEATQQTRWAELLSAVHVSSPDPLFDALVNHWLLYQTVSCRLWARAGFYQAGGAYGFRDQLQDAMALAWHAPELLRQQLLLAASRQFSEGDVQHWWHVPSGAGVRTRISDDLLWLPYAALHYLGVVGEQQVLDETVHFLRGDALAPGAEDAFFVPTVSEESASLYEHCARCLDRSLTVGEHGLPLMGGGDWNDGMNRVGPQGRGESVWLGWLLCKLVQDFAPLAHARADSGRAERWERAAVGWRAALCTQAWDGEWFKRAFFDDGTPLGSQAGAECRIDLIAQAWSVLSGAAPAGLQARAMASARALLFDDRAGLIRLLDPPLVKSRPYAGYIQAYPPGVRENGGQYAHAGVWMLMAQAALGDGDGAYLSFTRLSPAHRSAHPTQGPAYGLEPYVMAGDVYTQPPYVGRGGWSWYTGSAAWMYRAAVESLCGLQLEQGRLRLRPCLPGHWPQLALQLRHQGRRHELLVCAAWAGEAIAAALRRGARPLAVSQWLDLAEAGADSCHLLVLPAGRARDQGSRAATSELA